MSAVALLIIALVLIGHTRPARAELAMLHLDMCQPPCWIGITPGKTTGQEAEKYLRHMFPEAQVTGSDNDRHFIIPIRDDYRVMAVEIQSLDGVVNTIRISPLPVTISELITQWGNPHAMIVFSCDGGWTPYFNNVVDSYLMIESSKPVTGLESRLDSESVVVRFELFNATQELISQRDLRNWHGFTTYQHYTDAKRNFGICE